MTAPAISIETVDVLDLTPTCDTCVDPADYWVQVHRCGGYYACVPCYEKGRDWVVAGIRRGAYIRCTDCKQVFVTFESWATERVPLR